MIPILYDAFEKNFITNGIGFLTDTVECIVEEERNGTYELELKYPVNGHLADLIEEDSIIKVKANDDDEPQLFRIYKSGKQIRSNTTWYAEHISYELNANPVENFKISGVNAERAITTLFEAAALPHSFKAHSNITTTNKTSTEGVLSVRKILGGTEGSILDVWGGEYKFDNYDVWLYKDRGSNNDVTIEYGKNLLDAKQEKNIADVVTAVFPYAYYTPGSETAQDPIYISLPEKVLVHSVAENYATIKCMPMDFSEEWESGTIITQSMLRNKAWEYLNSGVTNPKINITLTFAALQKTKDYKHIKVLESVKMCDTVTVKIAKLGIDVTAKVMKTKYNTLKERYESVEIGETRTNLTKSIAVQQTKTEALIVKTQTRAEQIKQQVEQTIINATAAITGNSGGHVLIFPEQNPQEIFIMDTNDTTTAKNVWRWNLAGLGHSDSGINGTFTTAITADGKIVADFITAGELTGTILKAGTVYAEALDVEYKQSIKRYSDDQTAAAVEEMETSLKTTAEQIELTAKKIAENNMHNYILNGNFSNTLDNWYTSSSENVVINIGTLGVVAKVLKTSSTTSYIRQTIGTLPEGTYRIRYKAATAAGYEATARVQCNALGSTVTTTAVLKSNQYTEFERDIEITTGTKYIYFYAYVLNSPIYVTDVEVLGLMSEYTKSRLTLLDTAIEMENTRATNKEDILSNKLILNEQGINAEVTRAKGQEDLLSGRVSINESNVLIKVSKGDVSSQIGVESGTVNVKTNRMTIASTNFSLSGSGTVTSKGSWTSESGNYKNVTNAGSTKYYYGGSLAGQLSAASKAVSTGTTTGAVMDLETDQKALIMSIGNTYYYALNNGLNTGGNTKRHWYSGTSYFGDNCYVPQIRWTANESCYMNYGTLNGQGGTYNFASFYAEGGIGCNGTKYRIVDTENYGRIGMNALESTGAYFTDIGSGIILEDEKAYIYFDPVFLETIDNKHNYQVQLTATSIKTIKYAQKEDGYFIVHGQNNATFDWQITAKQKNYQQDYMESVDIQHEETIEYDESIFYEDEIAGIETQNHMEEFEDNLDEQALLYLEEYEREVN